MKRFIILLCVVACFVEKCLELFHRPGVSRGAGEVSDFAGVGLVIVKLHTGLAVVPFGVAIAHCADGSAERARVIF